MLALLKPNYSYAFAHTSRLKLLTSIFFGTVWALLCISRCLLNTPLIYLIDISNRKWPNWTYNLHSSQTSDPPNARVHHRHLHPSSLLILTAATLICASVPHTAHIRALCAVQLAEGAFIHSKSFNAHSSSPTAFRIGSQLKTPSPKS